MMPKPRRDDPVDPPEAIEWGAAAYVPQIADDDVQRIADEIERRFLRIFRPAPIPPMPDSSANKIDPNDLLTPQQAAHIAGKSDQTIHRWVGQFDISETIAGTTFISRRKLEAHLAHRDGRDDH
jgi:hypothetical protein